MRDIRIFSIGWMTAAYQMSSKSVDAELVAVAHELLGNGGQRTDDYNCRACESQIEVQQTSASSIPGGRRREATNMGKDFP